MSITICASGWVESSPRGTGFADAWFPGVVAERFVTSTKDGGVDVSPDPVPFIDADLTWTNTTDSPVRAWLLTQRAPRRLLGNNPNSYAIDDAISWDVGESPNAAAPYALESGVGARMMTTPFAVNQIGYGRIFRAWPDSVRNDAIGAVPAGDTVQVRYQALYTTPGTWRAPNQPLQTMHAYWVRLRLHTIPETTP